jgi:hypothetical protein
MISTFEFVCDNIIRVFATSKGVVRAAAIPPAKEPHNANLSGSFMFLSKCFVRIYVKILGE